MFFDNTRGALFQLLGQPEVVVTAVLLIGLHAAIWQLVLRRAGLPPALALLLLVPPLTLVLPLCFALVRWPAQRPTAPAIRPHRPLRRRVPAAVARLGQGKLQVHDPRGGLLLDADGFPRQRIPMNGGPRRNGGPRG